VGICSYLLIGFWHERPQAREAAKKAFIVTRIGDVGLLVGILLIWRDVGSFSMLDAFEAVRTGAMSESVATASALLLFLGAMGKSAQIPFHVWLPDAMEGPTPVSALIHAATMVIAGVFLVARTFPLFEAYDADPLVVVAIVGLVTALMAATIALVATDLKRILAYSTISHLGLMMLSLGAFGYTAAIFHLMAHGFSKALLFLGAGSVLHSTESQETAEMGGLRKVMPLTALVFSIGALSLGGIPILAGFWSKDEILVAVNDNRNVAFIALTLLTALLSALYMGRAMFLVFFGPLQDRNTHVHDAPIGMALPMALLGVLALGFGLISFNWPGSFGGIGTFVFFGHGEEFHFEVWIGAVSIAMAVAAFAFAYLAYARRSISLDATRSRFAFVLKVVENKYYFDEVYQWTVDRVVLVFSRFIGYFDRAIINDIAVNGPADLVRHFGVALRLHVSGHVYSYTLAMAMGTVGLGVFVWLRAV
jgi:NADH-quinone oxidoreductase subunit L